jgi:hypothetical protein
MQWIKTTDQLPPDRFTVYIYNKQSDDITSDCRYNHKREMWECYRGGEFDDHSEWRQLAKWETPTHWIKLERPTD